MNDERFGQGEIAPDPIEERETASFSSHGTDRPPSTASEPVPDCLGRYQIVELLGKGGFGIVFKARDPDSGQQLALKVLREELCHSDAHRQAFEREANAAKELKHPNFVHVFGLEHDELSRPFIVQQLIDGGSLRQWGRAAKHSAGEILELMIPVAEAVAYLHRARLFHRDLKPNNILLDHTGKPYLSDFGLAIHENELRQRDGEIAGTFGYMAPEQIRGRIKRIDGRTDIWSLGVILYELLSGRLPFGGVNPPADRQQYLAHLREAIEENDPEPLRAFVPELSRELEDICLRCLEKEKRHRFKTGDDLAEALRRYRDRQHRRDVQGLALAPPGLAAAVVPKGLRSFDKHDRAFFFELLPGPRAPDQPPACIRFWNSRLEAGGSEQRLDVCVVYGPSGSGKSSLVKAGVLPLLSDQVLAVTIEATADDTEARLVAALRKSLEGVGWILPPDISLPGIFKRLQQQGASGRKVLVVLDQFEQWLHTNPQPGGTPLVSALQHCNGVTVQALLLVRDDFWMPLTRLMDELAIPLREGENCAAVDLFDRAHARKVLTLFGRAYGRLPTTDDALTAAQAAFLDRAIDELAENEHVICVRLALFADLMQGRRWTLAELDAVGGAKGIGVKFLEEKLGPHAPAAYRNHRGAAQRVLAALLPASGSELRGQMRTVQQLRDAANQDEPSFQELLRVLDGNLKLLTPTSPDRSDAGPPPSGSAIAQCYQLTHDFLVPALREWLTSELRRTATGRALLRLRERSDDWNRRPEPRRLPTPSEWLAINARLSPRTWTVEQRRMMRRASGRILSRTGLVALIAALLSGIAWEINGRNRAGELHARLVDFDTTQVPGVVAQAASYQRWVRPLWEQAYDAEFASADAREPDLDPRRWRHRLHLSLALSQWQPDKLDYVVDHLAQVDPEALPAVIDIIRPQRQAAADKAWLRLQRSRGVASDTNNTETLPLAALLAGIAPADRRWDEIAPAVARQLAAARPAQFSAWLRHLGPVQDALRPSLLNLWKTRPAAGQDRSQLFEALARYAADDAPAFVAAVEDAEPTELPILGSVAANSKANIPPAVRRRLDELAGKVHGAAEQTARPPDKHLVEWFERYHGLLDEQTGFIQDLPLEDFATLAEDLRGEGYRPESFRPYQQAAARLVAATWRRDSRAFRTATDLTAQELLKADQKAIEDGLSIHDVARQGGARWAGLWVAGEGRETQTRFYLDLPYEQHAERYEAWPKLGLGIERFDIYAPETGSPLVTAIWRPVQANVGQASGPPVDGRSVDEADIVVESRVARAYGDLHPGYAQFDLRLEHLDPPRRDRLALYGRYFDNRRDAGKERFRDHNNNLLFTAARYQMAMGDFVPALATFDELRATSPKSSPLAESRATAMLFLGRMDDARQEIAVFESLKPATSDGESRGLLLRTFLASKEQNSSAAHSALQELESLTRREDSASFERLLLAQALVAGQELMPDDSGAAVPPPIQDRALASLRDLLERPETKLPEELVNRVHFDGLRTAPAFGRLLRDLGLDRRLIGAWQLRPEFETRQLIELAPSAHISEARRLRSEGFLPRVVSVSSSLAAEDPKACSVWERPIASPSEALAISRKLANLALLLAALRDSEHLERVLADRHGIESRSFVLERAAAMLPPAGAISLLRQAGPDGRLRNLLRLLGGYEVSAVSQQDRGYVDALTDKLASSANDAGVHAAARWLRQRWQLADAMVEASPPSEGERNWFRTSQGHTMVVLDLKQPVLVGSPADEVERDEFEMLHWVRIGRRIAIAATETTVRQFEEFLADPKVKRFYAKSEFTSSKKQYAPSPDCPQISVRWYDAARYCQWLSEKEGLPESEWCFPGIWDHEDGDLQLPPDILKRRGYRLPTEAEMESACRGGWPTARPFGNAAALLPAYAWLPGNAGGRTHEVGRLKPNDFGLFDVLGNVNEWCLDPYRAYRTPLSAMSVNQEVEAATGADARIVRGGSFASSAKELRSANRNRTAPNLNTLTIGFRIARSEPDDHRQ